MDGNNFEKTTDNEIDLRLIIDLIWNSRKAIAIATVLITVLTFIISSWFVPKKYESTAFVSFSQPLVTFNQPLDTNPSFIFSVKLPESKTIMFLSQSNNLIESVLTHPNFVEVYGEDSLNRSDFIKMVDVESVTADQISFQITDSDPDRAKTLANVWAAQVVEFVNERYGLDALIINLQSKKSEIQTDYEIDQENYEKALSTSTLTFISAQKNQAVSDLTKTLLDISKTNNIMNELQIFEKGLSGLAKDTLLFWGDSLVLTSLHEQAITVSSDSIILQINSDSFSGFTVSQALDVISQMSAELQSKLEKLQITQNELEIEIPILSEEREMAKESLLLYEFERNISYNLLKELSNEEIKILAANDIGSDLLYLSAEATASSKEAYPNAVFNTILGFTASLVTTTFLVLFIKWWQNKKE